MGHKCVWGVIRGCEKEGGVSREGVTEGVGHHERGEGDLLM